MKKAYIYSAKRTAIGSFMGSLAPISATQLGAICGKAILKSHPAEVDEVIVGCVLQASLGQAPARQVAIFSGLPEVVRAMTVNKVCGSGLKAVTAAADRIALTQAEVIMAGGIENMSQVPYYLKSAREGFRMGHQEVVDGLIHDGLWDVYNQFHMGKAAELCAKEYKFTREAQDEFATQSYRKAMKAIENGLFKNEIVPVELNSKQGSTFFDTDEEPTRGKIEKFPSLKPVFEKNGTVTVANASSISDGAAMCLIGSDTLSPKWKPMAQILHAAEGAQKPEWFTTAPVGCIQKLLKEANLKTSDIDIFEINEAFSVVAMVAQKELQIPPEKLNPRGGAVALGHPIGASGARILTTLLHTLKPGQKGVASLCIGGGEAIAILIEKM